MGARDLAARMTDRQQQALDRRLQQNYRTALNTALERQKEAIDRLLAFDEAQFPGLSPEQLQTKKRAYVRRVMRQTDIANNIAAEIARGGQAASQMIQDELARAFSLNLDWGRYSLDRQAGVFLDWPMLDNRQMQVLMKRQQSPFTRISYRRMGQSQATVNKLKNAFRQSMMLGESRRQLEQRIAKVCRYQTLYQARRTAQTEIVRIQSQARYHSMAEAADMGLELEKEWRAKMVNTRDTHKDLDGEVVEWDKPFVTSEGNELMYPGDPSAPAEEVIFCHCYVMERLKNVPESVRRYREEMAQNYGFNEWRAKKKQELQRVRRGA